MYLKPCGSGLARDGYVSGDIGFDGVHIRCCGNGHLRLRPYGGLLGKTERRPAPSNQAPAPLTYGLPTGKIKIKAKIKNQSEAA